MPRRGRYRKRADKKRRVRVDRRLFEKVIFWLMRMRDKGELPEEFSNDFLSFCSILYDISKGKDSPNYHVLKKCVWNNEVVEQFIIENAKFTFSYFAPHELKESYYDILHVSSTYSSAELRKKWLDLVKIYHPDKFGNRGVDVTKKINEAYEVLSDPEKRRGYEAQRLHVMPVVLKEPTWRESASNKVAYLLTTISRWKNLYNTAIRIMNHKGNIINITPLSKQHLLDVMIRKRTRNDFSM